MLRDQSLVLSERVANDGSKVIDEMRVIKIPQLKRELDPIRPAARIQLFDRLMQTITANDLLWTARDILIENPLNRTLADSSPSHF